MTEGSSAAALANDAVRVILQTQWNRVPAVRVDSPPGAGKTGVVERLAVQALGILGERCAIATQTNQQAFDLVARLTKNYPRLTFWLYAKQDLALPKGIASRSNLQVARKESELPAGPCVVIANAHKWSYVWGRPRFDLLVVDEAFQLPDFRFHEIADLGDRLVLVGDPGQIAPIIRCEIERWRSDPSGPHVAAPDALAHRHPSTSQIQLPVSWRLVDDTVGFVQPAFYPSLPFKAASTWNDRQLVVVTGIGSRVDSIIDAAARGLSILSLELPDEVTGQSDPEVAELIVRLIERLNERRARVREGEISQELEPSHIGVVCAHVSQVNAVVRRLPTAWKDVLVETADRLQGLERSVMIVHHPLSGRVDATQFHLDIGRLCVMLSRHRVACFIVSRAGIENVLERYSPNSDRVLGLNVDREHLGWRANMRLAGALRESGRVFPIPSSS